MAYAISDVSYSRTKLREFGGEVTGTAKDPKMCIPMVATAHAATRTFVPEGFHPEALKVMGKAVAEVYGEAGEMAKVLRRVLAVFDDYATVQEFIDKYKPANHNYIALSSIAILHRGKRNAADTANEVEPLNDVEKGLFYDLHRKWLVEYFYPALGMRELAAAIASVSRGRGQVLGVFYDERVASTMPLQTMAGVVEEDDEREAKKKKTELKIAGKNAFNSQGKPY